MNWNEAEASDQIFYVFDRFRVITGHEDHTATTILCGPFVEAFNDYRIERLHNPGAGCQRSDHLARALVSKVSQYEIRGVRAERVRRVDEHPSVPRGQASKCVFDIRPGDG